MASVSMQQVKELRERTQAGLGDCKAALVEAGGDMEQAVEIILKKGLAKSAKRAGAVATEGLVLAQVEDDGQRGVVVEVNIQTDFAARNAEFVAFANRVLEVARAARAGADLGAEAYPGGSGTVEEARQALVGKLGENITVRRWDRVAVDGPGRVHAYVHLGNKIGVLLAARVGDAAAAGKPELLEFLDNTAMQVAAMAPLYLREADVLQAARDKQTEIYDAQLAEEGKPEKVRPKIIEGKLAKWLREVCLIEQQSVIDTEHSIDQIRQQVGVQLGTDLELTGFVRFERGEGVEKPDKPDFAEEVARLAGG